MRTSHRRDLNRRSLLKTGAAAAALGLVSAPAIVSRAAGLCLINFVHTV